MRRLLLILLVSSLALLVAIPIGASPVCSDTPQELCGGRIFPEAELSVSFVQHDSGEYVSGINALAEAFPDFVRVRSLTEVLGKETLSAEGRDIWLIEVTDFSVPKRDKLPVAVSLSVHGTERAGLEGGVRYAEDLARWATDDPDHELRNGTEDDSIGMPVSQVLKKVHLYLVNLNPDGWAAGDLANGGVFSRGNGNGVDLNREFPTKGWTKTSYTPLSEPESKAWDKVVRDIDPVTGTDLHGELTSANNAYADIMLPAGQWDPKEQAQEERLARHMASNVTRYFEEQGIVAGDVTGVAGMKPAEYATGYDVVGYDDSGFMGDYFTEQIGMVEVDVEHFLSHMVPNSTWLSGHEDAHIASVRGEIETLMVEALVVDDIEVSLDLGKAGYLFDAKRVTSKNGYGGPKPPKGVKPQSYDVSRMQYFKDLSKYAKQPLKKIPSNRVTARSLRGLDTFVIAGRHFPRTPDGRKPRKKKIVKVVGSFVRGGGNLVLTDGALRMLHRLKVVKPKAVARSLHNAGHIDIENFEDPYLKKVHTTASQTYYEVALGYSADEDASPHYTVDRAAWEGAGGTTMATVSDEQRVGLGRLELGKGTIGIFGALLPDPTEAYDHFFGLADYAVTVAGGQILNNMIAHPN